ncbi:demethylmenaquinone methyltransferase [Pseudalkalibacillus berkeleyi]|uniref:Demethylmenaquinone methyltransferase n=1 Tax=Pseudalkalibacillus berkeleyi TaxID=1069813 RepID=A0ABS9GXU4_9BACL|nr:demethylmenaquinone methyltransferase [Pseudalkalibacillus berkeleyi]MCF6137578.1 demethylmenaquinone methyltransferase [Pseudalkalibacillus berkeleyi]
MQQETKEQRVHQVFESISKNYDKMNSIISFQRHVAWRRDTMKRMNVQEGSTTLDVCCGTADWTIAMAEAIGDKGQAYGLDFSKNMLEVGKEKVKREGYSNITLLHGNAMELPFEDGTFDYVTIGFGLRNVPDLNQVLKEMHRVLKKGGMVVCLETSQPTMPVFKQMYYGYFRFIMPVMGRLFAKSYQEYSWLQESAKEFPGRKALSERFERAGFENVIAIPYSGGVAATHIGNKPSE